MRRGLCILVVVSFLWSNSRAEEPISIPDARLKSAIEGDLWVSDPTPTDMLALTSLTVRGAGISSLVGLEYAVNLQSLDLRENRISDLYPLGGLTALESLNLSMNQVSNVSPLSGLTNLTSLDVHDNHQVHDISALSGLIKMQSLTLRHNTITDISALSGMSELQSLDLFENQISDVSALTGLYSLTYVDLRSNPLAEGTCETDLLTIAENNPGMTLRHDRCGPRQISISATAGGHVMSPGEGVFEYANGEIIYLEAKADPCFVFVGWSGSTTSSENPMRYMMQGDQEIRANFASLLDELYVDDDDPNDPKPGDAQVSNPQETGARSRPFDSIQEAIDVARDGVTIVVRSGTYSENLDLLGKKIHLLAIDPANPQSGPCAIVEGRNGGPVVRISWGSQAKCGLSGFVLTKGKGQAVAALYCIGASPTLDNCLIVGNRCSDVQGAALYFEDSQAILSNCTIADNYAGWEGAGVVIENSNIVVVNSVFWGNTPNEISSRGDSDPSIRYCDVRGWWPDIGNLRVDPLFAAPGSWVNSANPGELLSPEDSRAVWKAGDYRLKSTSGRWDPTTRSWLSDEVSSPCIDTGDSESPIGFEPTPNGGVINMGAYGGTTEASKSP